MNENRKRCINLLFAIIIDKRRKGRTAFISFHFTLYLRLFTSNNVNATDFVSLFLFFLVS